MNTAQRQTLKQIPIGLCSPFTGICVDLGLGLGEDQCECTAGVIWQEAMWLYFYTDNYSSHDPSHSLLLHITPKMRYH